MSQSFYAHGKILLTGEYLVLDGAEAIVLPTILGQSMVVEKYMGHTIDWSSFAPSHTLEDEKKLWFSAEFSTRDFSIRNSTNRQKAETISYIMQQIKQMNPNLWKNKTALRIKITSDFPMNWGLGSSSTLLYMLADWANINPFLLSSKTLGGSGFDIACAKAKAPIIYSREYCEPKTHPISFEPEFKDKLHFVYLNKKQNTREAIEKYSKQKINPKWIDHASHLSRKIASTQNDLNEFEQLIEEHENLISKLLNTNTVKKSLFPDYKGMIKSLGAWGGDFILVTQRRGMKNYFRSKGFPICIPFHKFILS